VHNDRIVALEIDFWSKKIERERLESRLKSLKKRRGLASVGWKFCAILGALFLAIGTVFMAGQDRNLVVLFALLILLYAPINYHMEGRITRETAQITLRLAQISSTKE